MVSCVGQVKQDAAGNTTVTLPIMARADRFAVNADDGHGKKLKVMVVNGNAESVPNNAVNLIGTGLTLKAGVKINENNNDQKNFSTAAGVAGQKPTVLTNTSTSPTGASETVQSAVPFVAPTRIPK